MDQDRPARYRIAYVGNFRPSHSTETHVAATLEDMGHVVTRIQESPDGELPMAEVAQSDMLLWTRTWPGFVRLKDLETLRGLNIPTVSYHLDLYMGLKREISLTTDPFWRTDFVFTPDGDPQSAREFERHGINHHWLPAGVFAPEAIAGTYRSELDSDIAFVGGVNGYHPEWPYRRWLYDFLKDNYGYRVKFYGDRLHPTIRGQRLNDLYASTRIVVGDSLCPNFTHQNYWSDRLYETTGRGGFLIHPWVAGIESQFKNRTEVPYYQYGDWDNLRETIDFYLANESIRYNVQVASWQRARKEHTYHHRMKTLLEVSYQIPVGHSQHF